MVCISNAVSGVTRASARRNSHRTGGATDLLLRSLKIVGVEVGHLDLCDLFNIGIRNGGRCLRSRVAGCFCNACLLTDENRCWRRLQDEIKGTQLKGLLLDPKKTKPALRDELLRSGFRQDTSIRFPLVFFRSTATTPDETVPAQGEEPPDS